MELKVEYVNIDTIKPYKRNAKTHPKEQVEQIKKSIQEFGNCDPIGVWHGEIVEGHGRYLALKELGETTIPIIRLDSLTDEQRRAYGLVHNQLTMNSPWDLPALDLELADLDFDMGELGFNLDAGKDFFENRERNDKSKQEGNEEYNSFVEKFEEKKTTDDCYTPDEVYEAVADFVADEYKIDKKNFVRPFYPGGDYQKFRYPKGCVVVDNPPFSILAEIQRFYCENNIKFFLFAPALTIFSSRLDVCAICVGVSVIYENGANVSTSFVTNLENVRFKSCPRLYNAVFEANKINVKKQHKHLPKYQYPPNVTTAAMLNNLSLRGVEFEGARDEVAFVRELDEQKEYGKAIFGNGFLISDRKAQAQAQAKAQAQEKAQAKAREREQAEAQAPPPDVWTLSARELEIIKKLK